MRLSGRWCLVCGAVVRDRVAHPCGLSLWAAASCMRDSRERGVAATAACARDDVTDIMTLPAGAGPTQAAPGRAP
jgi:hypothetical protein